MTNFIDSSNINRSHSEKVLLKNNKLLQLWATSLQRIWRKMRFFFFLFFFLSVFFSRNISLKKVKFKRVFLNLICAQIHDLRLSNIWKTLNTYIQIKNEDTAEGRQYQLIFTRLFLLLLFMISLIDLIGYEDLGLK